ncbi:MAG: hypothetical protein M1814_005398 [Vezdaea aestivalis]|nr:MAG: hypothetical protein M1814_005398 [Vezdaea aestivalis]
MADNASLMKIQKRQENRFMRFLRRETTPPKLLFYFLFHGMHVAMFGIGWWKQVEDIRLAALNTLSYSVWLSRGAGLALSVDAALILLPMCRNLLRIIRPKLRWLPLDESQFFHRQCAYSILFFTAIHTSAHYVNFFNVERYQLRSEAAVEIHYTQVGGITGHVMLFCMFMMYTTAHKAIRTQSFETFWYTHHLFIPFLLALYTHATGCFVRDSVKPHSPFAGNPFWTHCIGYEGWRWELFGGGIYFFERVYRELNSRRYTEITRVVRHTAGAIEIQFAKPSMRYKPGQWLFINVPEVSRGQWHPFTVTSCPQDPYVSIHVRQLGDWTRDLGDALGCGAAQAKDFDGLDPDAMYEIATQQGQSLPRIRIDGPYGAPAEDVFSNEIAILIGAGIGVTPWASILKSIYHRRAGPNPPRRLRRVEFIWIAKETTSFGWFQALLASLEQQALEESRQPGTEFLRIHTYLTQKLDADAAQNIVLNSVGAEADPLTELKARTNFGRPDFDRLFAAMRTGICNQSYVGGTVAPGVAEKRGRTEVGVYFCGPNTAARQIKKACHNARTKEVDFKFWKEHF